MVVGSGSQSAPSSTLLVGGDVSSIAFLLEDWQLLTVPIIFLFLNLFLQCRKKKKRKLSKFADTKQQLIPNQDDDSASYVDNVLSLSSDLCAMSIRSGSQSEGTSSDSLNCDSPEASPHPRSSWLNRVQELGLLSPTTTPTLSSELTTLSQTSPTLTCELPFIRPSKFVWNSRKSSTLNSMDILSNNNFEELMEWTADRG